MLGVHVSGTFTDKKFYESMPEGYTFQCFLNNPRSSHPRKKDISNELKVVKKIISEKKLNMFSHSPYPVILSNILDEKHNYIRKIIESELEILKKIRGKGLVVHFGRNIDVESLQDYAYVLDDISDIISDTDISILLENNVGGPSFKIISDFFAKLSKRAKKNIKLCLDTAHVWGNGEDIRTKEKAKSFLKFISDIPMGLCHANMPKESFGKIIDRHGSIKTSPMDFEVMKVFLKHCYKNNIPMIIEKPTQGDIDEYTKYLDSLKKT